MDPALYFLISADVYIYILRQGVWNPVCYLVHTFRWTVCVSVWEYVADCSASSSLWHVFLTQYRIETHRISKLH